IPTHACQLNPRDIFSDKSRVLCHMSGMPTLFPFFHAVTPNMAALLRSVRFLKLSPLGVLQTTGSKRTGPPLARLCSRAACGRWTGALPLQSRHVYAVATEQRDEASVAVRSRQAEQFDWALTKLDSSVRRTGRITKTLLLRIFHDICRKGYPSGNQALLLLRSCGSLLPEMKQDERTELAHRVWDELQKLEAQYDVSHYNALLKVYLQNEFKFSPTDFLAKMEAANVQPNRVTYQRLIAAYCQNGDIEGASTILGFMKSKDLPITEAVFSSLVTGHARAGDIESAKNIFSVMRGAGIEPGPEAYLSLLNAYAEIGDLENIQKSLEAAESADCGLMDRDIMQVISTMARFGHSQLVPEMAKRLRHGRGFIPDAMNLCLSLITQGQEDTAFYILKAFPSLQSENTVEDFNIGNFFLRHCINADTPLEKIVGYCKELQESNMHSAPLSFTLSCALEAKKLELMKLFKEQGFPIRPHYFWPLFTPHTKEKNVAGVMEVVKGMAELSITPDTDTFSDYIFPAFPSTEAAQQAIKVIYNWTWLLKLFVIIFLCNHFVFHLCFPVSDPSYSPPSLGVFRNNLMADPATYFLYNLIASMSEEQMQAQEDKLRSFFNQLQAENVTVSLNIFRGIRKFLTSNNVFELIKVLTLESCLQFSFVVLRVSVCDQKLQRALELKQQYEEEMTPGAYAALINLCCRHNNVEEAIDLKRELSRKDPSVTLDASKSFALVKTLATNGRVEEAVDILKEMKEKDVVLSNSNITALFHMFNAVVSKGGVDTVRRLQDTVFTLGLAKPTSNLCSPLITAYLENNDFSGALDASFECQKRYKQLPRIHDIIVALVENGDTDLLQKVMDFVSQERGEMTMLYDLFFAFVQTGRYREARKIIETPGLRARPGRMQWFAEKCISAQQMEALEQMADMTAKLFECDRDDMYYYVLRLCKETNNWKKAEAMWTKMQEENVIPRERTLRLLADVFKSNGQEVPFAVPEVMSHSPPALSSTSYTGSMLTLCKKGKAKGEHVVQDAEKNGVILGPSPYDVVIRALLAEGSIEEAMAVKDIAQSHIPNFKLSEIASSLLIIAQSKKGQVKDALEQLKLMFQSDQIPMQLAITRVVQAMGSHGDIAGIQEVESLMKNLSTSLNLSRMLFVNNLTLAHIQNGDLEAAVEILEGIYTSPDGSNSSMSFIFRKVLEADNDQALDKLSAMAERLANHFACYRPATDLFLQLLENDKYEDAKFMLAVSIAVSECSILPQPLLSHASFCAQVGKIKSLMNLIPDFAEKEVLYAYLLKSHVVDEDLTSAKALHEQMQKEGMTVDELSLKRLAGLYRKVGETLPFPDHSFHFYTQLLLSKLLFFWEYFCYFRFMVSSH
uniref:Pentacotripeptide-repeat region of PRORP domain-containing protein n=1 Tax=Gouania willdenowi TaxID=441366 RepID=A0A8C5H6M7_GOUWI